MSCIGKLVPEGGVHYIMQKQFPELEKLLVIRGWEYFFKYEPIKSELSIKNIACKPESCSLWELGC